MRFFRMLIATVSLMLFAGLAYADEPVAGFSARMADPAFAARVEALFDGAEQPDWLPTATEAEPVTVTLGGEPMTVLLACKKHDCGSHQFIVIFDDTLMQGVLMEGDDTMAHEQLTWLGTTGEQSDIDRRTVLYAAISGSLYNHPETFDYPAPD